MDTWICYIICFVFTYACTCALVCGGQRTTSAAPGILGITSTHHHFQYFYMSTGTWTHVLMLAKQAAYWLSYLPSPCYIFLIKVDLIKLPNQQILAAIYGNVVWASSEECRLSILSDFKVLLNHFLVALTGPWAPGPLHLHLCTGNKYFKGWLYSLNASYM